MKKTICITMSFLIILSIFAGCSKRYPEGMIYVPTDNLSIADNTTKEITNNTKQVKWDTYELKYKNQSFTLPISYSNFTEITNTKVLDLVKKEIVHSKEYSIQSETFYFANEDLNNKANLVDKLLGSIRVYNPYNYDTEFENCMIVELFICNPENPNFVRDFIFPGNLKINDSYTNNDLINMFGEESLSELNTDDSLVFKKEDTDAYIQIGFNSEIYDVKKTNSINFLHISCKNDSDIYL